VRRELHVYVIEKKHAFEVLYVSLRVMMRRCMVK